MGNLFASDIIDSSDRFEEGTLIMARIEAIPKELLGIWTDNLSMWNLNKLRDQGFNSLMLQIGYFWKMQGNAPDQDKAVFWMFQWYTEAKKLGFKFFLIDCGWGLGALDNNYFYEKIIAKFKECGDVKFYFGEPIESFIETKKYTWPQVCKEILNKRFVLTTKGNFVTDATTRNFIQLYNYMPGKTAISSYYNQHQLWNSHLPFVWIYGQLKIGGSLRYKKLSQIANSLNIETRFLYQADPPEWSWCGWIIKLLRIVHLQNWFENWQRKRFIKYFN